MVYVKIKKLGKRYGVILPKGLVKEKGFVEDEIVDVEIKKKNESLRGLFGTLKRIKQTQEIKDELRAGWDE
jgi:antitoxin component of MazEF toxin-antitoxin module